MDCMRDRGEEWTRALDVRSDFDVFVDTGALHQHCAHFRLLLGMCLIALGITFGAKAFP